MVPYRAKFDHLPSITIRRIDTAGEPGERQSLWRTSTEVDWFCLVGKNVTEGLIPASITDRRRLCGYPTSLPQVIQRHLHMALALDTLTLQHTGKKNIRISSESAHIACKLSMGSLKDVELHDIGCSTIGLGR